MIVLLQYLFLLATDVVLAVTLSCLLYALACASVALLTCCAIALSCGTADRGAGVRGRAIVILVSNSSIGRMFARNLDRAGFGVAAAQWAAREERTVTPECPSNKEGSPAAPDRGRVSEDSENLHRKPPIPERHVRADEEAIHPHLGRRGHAWGHCHQTPLGGQEGLQGPPQELPAEHSSSLHLSPLPPPDLCPDSPEEKPTAARAPAEAQELTASKEPHGAPHTATVTHNGKGSTAGITRDKLLAAGDYEQCP
ncbi:uncharacterized protein GJ701_001509 isoform 2-T2 [Geothlypis trichas]